MKIALIIVALKETKKYADRVRTKFEKQDLGKLNTFIVINERGREGYAQGVNKGIKLAKSLNLISILLQTPTSQI